MAKGRGGRVRDEAETDAAGSMAPNSDGRSEVSSSSVRPYFWPFAGVSTLHFGQSLREQMSGFRRRNSCIIASQSLFRLSAVRKQALGFDPCMSGKAVAALLPGL